MGPYPRIEKVAVKIKARVDRYALINDILYMRSFFGPYKRCVSTEEAKHIIIQVHGGICDSHIGC